VILFKARLEGRIGIKKNGKQISVRGGRVFVRTSENYKNWHSYASVIMLQQKNFSQFPMPIKEPINLSCKFHFPNHQGEPDLSNLYQGIEDILQEIGVIENDKLIYSHDGSRKIFGAPAFLTEIEIIKLTDL
jgi:Holliday junction resolvase RusA-like endonuclease